MPTDKVNADTTFSFCVQDVYYLGGIGVVVVGNVLSGAIDTRTRPVLTLVRTNKKIRVEEPKYMHCQVTDEMYWVKADKLSVDATAAFTVSGCKKNDFEEGDILQN